MVLMVLKWMVKIVGDRSGYSISAAGDINGDGHIGFLIGAPGYKGSKGRSYVVFGGYGMGRQWTFWRYRVSMALMVLNWMVKMINDQSGASRKHGWRCQ